MDVMEAEEAASIPKETYEQVMSPLLLMDKTVAIFISTMMGEDNYFTSVFERVNPKSGKKIFTQFRISLLCNRPQCRARPETCWHFVHRIPPWQSLSKHIISRGMIDSNEVALRELSGMIADDGVKVFDRAAIEQAFSARTTDLNRIGLVKFCIVSVDPNNDGSSKYAIVSILFSDTISTIVGMDLIGETGFYAQRDAFLDHISMLRRVIRNCVIFLAVESNIGGHVATQHYEWLELAGLARGIVLLNESTTAGLPGVWTHISMKESMCADFQNVLRYRVFTVYAGAIGRNVDADIKELEDEFKRYARYSTRGNGRNGTRSHSVLSGKGPSNNLNDDGATATMQAYAMYRVLTSNVGIQKYAVRLLPTVEPLPVPTLQRS